MVYPISFDDSSNFFAAMFSAIMLIAIADRL